MRFLKRAVVVLVVLVAGVYGAGMSMPREHLASSRIQLTASPDSVFAVLRAFGDYPTWDADFKSSVRGEQNQVPPCVHMVLPRGCAGARPPGSLQLRELEGCTRQGSGDLRG